MNRGTDAIFFHSEGGGGEKFIPRGVDRAPYIPPGGSGFPKNSGDIVFEDKSGRAMCWKMGQQTSEEFVRGKNGVPLKGANDVLFNSGKVKVFFPIMDASHKDGAYYAVKSLTIKANPTLARVLATIETCAQHSIADHLIKDRFASRVTLEDIKNVLNHVVCCHLVCSRAGGWNMAFVRVAKG